MMHEQAAHFDSRDLPEVLQAARLDQILRLLQDIAAVARAGEKTAGSQNGQA